MAFCAKGIGKAKKFLNEIDEVLEPILEEVIDFTGKVKNLKEDRTVQQIDDLIPDNTALQGYFDTALTLITGAASTAGTFAEKLQFWLHGKSELESNSNLAKLASVTTAVAHGKKHSESFYDTAVQVQIEGLK